MEKDKNIGLIAKSLNVSKEINSGIEIRRDFFCEHLVNKIYSALNLFLHF